MIPVNVPHWAAYDTIAELRRENAELSTKYHETHRVYAEMSENREKIESKLKQRSAGHFKS